MEPDKSVDQFTCDKCNGKGRVWDDDNPSGVECGKCWGLGVTSKWVPIPDPVRTVASSEPETERYVMIGTKCTQKEGWQYETTISIRTTDDALIFSDALLDLHNSARIEALAEIVIREAEDQPNKKTLHERLKEGENV